MWLRDFPWPPYRKIAPHLPLWCIPPPVAFISIRYTLFSPMISSLTGEPLYQHWIPSRYLVNIYWMNEWTYWILFSSLCEHFWYVHSWFYFLSTITERLICINCVCIGFTVYTPFFCNSRLRLLQLFHSFILSRAMRERDGYFNLYLWWWNWGLQ